MPSGSHIYTSLAIAAQQRPTRDGNAQPDERTLHDLTCVGKQTTLAAVRKGRDLPASHERSDEGDERTVASIGPASSRAWLSALSRPRTGGPNSALVVR